MYYTTELKELGTKLRKMYDNAPYGESTTMIHLFGIKYADIIKKSGFSARDVITSSGLNDSYVTELSKGIRLNKYVMIKKEKDIF